MSLQPIDPDDPTQQPLLLIPSDVITIHPTTGARGEWTFCKARDLGLTVELECVTGKGREVRFEVARSGRVHVQPRGTGDFWAA